MMSNVLPTMLSTINKLVLRMVEHLAQLDHFPVEMDSQGLAINV